MVAQELETMPEIVEDNPRDSFGDRWGNRTLGQIADDAKEQRRLNELIYGTTIDSFGSDLTYTSLDLGAMNHLNDTRDSISLPVIHEVTDGKENSHYIDQNGIVDLYQSVNSSPGLVKNSLEGSVNAPGFRGDSRAHAFAEELASEGITDRKEIMARGRQKGFTLIELLVVTSIIALLVGILLPALGAAKTMARKTQCGSNESQLGKATYIHANDHNNRIPEGPPVTDAASAHLYSMVEGPRNHGKFYQEKQMNTLSAYFCPEAKFFTENSTVFGAQKWNTGTVVSSYLWRNTSGGNLGTRLDNYKEGHALILDHNQLFSSSIFNHEVDADTGTLKYVNILKKDGSVKGVQDPLNQSHSAGNKDAIYLWADSQ